MMNCVFWKVVKLLQGWWVRNIAFPYYYIKSKRQFHEKIWFLILVILYQTLQKDTMWIEKLLNELSQAFMAIL